MHPEVFWILANSGFVRNHKDAVKAFLSLNRIRDGLNLRLDIKERILRATGITNRNEFILEITDSYNGRTQRVSQLKGRSNP